MLIIDTPLKKIRRTLDTSKTWAENILSAHPQLLDPDFTTINLNGKAISNQNFDCNDNPNSDDLITICVRPHGVELVVSLVVAVVAAAASYILARRALGNLGDRAGKDSGNTQFTGQTNTARLYSQRPDIYGKVRAYPDLIGEALLEYVNNKKVLTHYFNIGLGYYDLTQFRFSDSALASFQESTYTVYQPGEVNPVVREQFSFPEIDSSGTELKGVNEADPDPSAPSFFSTPSSVGIDASSTFTVVYDNPTPTIPPSSGGGQLGIWYNNRTLDNKISSEAVRFTYNISNPFGGSTEYEYTAGSATISFDDVSDKYTIISENFRGETGSFGGFVGKVGITEAESFYVGWFLSTVECTELWFNTVFRRGLKGTAVIEFECQPCDSQGNPSGASLFTTATYNDDTFDDQSFTFKVQSLPSSYYRVRARRTNNSNDDGSSQSTLESIAAIRVKTNVVHPEDTTLTIQSTAGNAETGTEMKFNVMASRKMIWWDGSAIRGWNAVAKAEIPSDLRSSEFAADGILHNYIVMGGGSVDEIDVNELYAIHDKVYSINPEITKCSITFDDADQALGDRVKTLALLLDVETSYDGIKEFFVREEQRGIVVAQFDAYNLADDQYSKTYSFMLKDQYTGVRLEWVDVSEKNKKRYINLALDSNGNVIESDSFHPKEIKFLGCGNETQAMHRAKLELNKLIHQNESVTFNVVDDGFIPRFGDLVRFVEYADEYVVNGEVIGISGNTYTSSAWLGDLEDGVTYWATCTKANGKTTDWVELASWNAQSFTTTSPMDGAYVADQINSQVGSRFIIRTTAEKEADLYVITDKQPSSDGTVKISCINYDERTYQNV
ncbi:MAG: host specificity factor TipJ family phage tail protein [Aeromonadaceae bacterium]